MIKCCLKYQDSDIFISNQRITHIIDLSKNLEKRYKKGRIFEHELIKLKLAVEIVLKDIQSPIKRPINYQC